MEDYASGCIVLSDTQRKTYEALELHRSALRLMDPRTAINTLKSLFRGYRQSSVQGAALQQGGCLVIAKGGKTLFLERDRFGGDHSKIEEVLACLDGA